MDLSASVKERARRRYKELIQRGTPTDFDKILAEMEQRDYQDSHRETAPLRPAEDGVIVDTTSLNFDESCEKILNIIKERVGA